MSAARTTLGLWLLLQLLLGSLQGHSASALASEASAWATAAHWHSDAVRRDRAEALSEQTRTPRTPRLSADDMLADAGAAVPHPAGPQVPLPTATPGCTGAATTAAYRARAPPLPA